MPQQPNSTNFTPQFNAENTTGKVQLRNPTRNEFKFITTDDELADVAFTGDYNDLGNLPDIPAEAPVQSVNGRIGEVVGLAEQSDLQAHINNTSNPHSVTKAQVGLSNVDNTADLNKPISAQQQDALNGKLSASDAETSFFFTNPTIVSGVTVNDTRFVNIKGITIDGTIFLPVVDFTQVSGGGFTFVNGMTLSTSSKYEVVIGGTFTPDTTNVGITTGVQAKVGTDNFSSFSSGVGYIIATTTGAGNARTIGDQIAVVSGQTYTLYYRLTLANGQSPSVIFSNNNGTENRSNLEQLSSGGELLKVQLTITATGNYRLSFRADNIVGTWRIDYFLMAGSAPDASLYSAGQDGMFKFHALNNLINQSQAGILKFFNNTVSGANYTTLSNPDYGTIEAVSSGAAKCVSNRIAVTAGEIYVVLYYLELASGVAPMLQFTDSGGVAKSTAVTTEPGKLNIARLTILNTGNFSLGSNVTEASNYTIKLIAIGPNNIMAGGVLNAMLYRGLIGIADYQPTEYTYDTDPTTVNLHNKATDVDDHYIDISGVIDGGTPPIVPTNYAMTARIPHQPNMPIYFRRTSTAGYLGGWFDANDNLLQFFSGMGGVLTGTLGVTPPNVSYGLYNVSSNPATRQQDKDSFQISYTDVPYEPHKLLITQINGYNLAADAVDPDPDPEPEPIVERKKKALAILLSQDNDRVFDQPNGTRDGLTYTGGVTVSGYTLTLAGASQSVATNLPFAFKEKLVAEACIRVNSGNFLNLQLRSGTTIIRQFKFDPAGTITVDTSTPTVYSPANILLTAEVRVRLWFNVLTKTCFLSVLYYDSTGATNVDKQQHFFTADFPLIGNEVDNVCFTTDSGTAGNGFVRGLVVYEPKVMFFGTSIIAGTGAGTSNFNPVPRFKTQEVLEQQPSYWMDLATGNKRKCINYGVASGDSAVCLDRLPDYLRFQCEVYYSDMGVTNDIQDGVLTDAETKANIDDMIALITNLPTDAEAGQGKIAIYMDCLPRDVFDSADIARATSTNYYVEQKCLSNTRLAKEIGGYAFFQDPAAPTELNPIYCNEASGSRTHLNSYGQKQRVNLDLQAASNV